MSRGGCCGRRGKYMENQMTFFPFAMARRWMAILGAILAMGTVTSADAGLFGLGGTGWKEEALQPDGTKLVVERNVARKGRHEIGQRPPIGNQSLLFVIPGSGEKVRWEDPYSEELGGANFNVMLAGVSGDAAYVLAAPAGCLSYNKWGRPNPPYVAFRYRNKEWQRIPMQAFPAEFIAPNLIISSPDDEAEKIGKPIISVEEIRQANQGFQQAEYQSILREAINNAGSRCGEMVFDGNGSWIGISWFRKQPSVEACKKFCDQKSIGAEFCPCNSIFQLKGPGSD
jgi:hypothetical protein